MAHAHAAAQVAARRDVHGVFYAAIMVHRGSCVDDHLSAQRRVGIDDAAGHDDAAWADGRPPADAGARVNRAGEAPAMLIQVRCHGGTAGIVSDGDDNVAQLR